MTLPELDQLLTTGAVPVILCAPWAHRAPQVQCAERNCCCCGQAIAIDVFNLGRIERDGMVTACIHCAYLANPHAFMEFFSRMQTLCGGALLNEEESRQLRKAILNPEALPS